MASHECPFKVVLRCRGLTPEEEERAKHRYPARNDTHFHSALLFRLCPQAAAVAPSPPPPALESPEALPRRSAVFALVDPCAVSDFTDVRDRLARAIPNELVRPTTPEEALRILQHSVFQGKDGVRLFTFDTVYGPHSTNEDIYTEVVRPLVEGARRGFSGTCLAYGQTGAGKTHTMLGDVASRRFPHISGRGGANRRTPARGLCSLAAADLLHYGKPSEGLAPLPRAADTPSVVMASYVELYNEQLRDLLADAASGDGGDGAHLSMRRGRVRKLAIQEHPSDGVRVAGLSEHCVSSPDHLEALLRHGAAQRTTARTAANAASSRSHAVLQLRVRTRILDRPQAGDDCGAAAGGSKSSLEEWVAPGPPLCCVDGNVPDLPRPAGPCGSSATVARLPRDGAGAEEPRRSCYSYSAVLTFVDLAGSEREQPAPAAGGEDLAASRSNVGFAAGGAAAQQARRHQQRQREGSHINRSLLALGNCIGALVAGVPQSAHRAAPGSSPAATAVVATPPGFVPYRSSRLTRLLKESLGGTTRTIMIATVSPSCHAFSETLSTLRYAERARCITRTVQQRIERTPWMDQLDHATETRPLSSQYTDDDGSVDGSASVESWPRVPQVGHGHQHSRNASDSTDAGDLTDCMAHQLEEEIRAMQTQLRVSEMLADRLGFSL